jgi:hypothetical protein
MSECGRVCVFILFSYVDTVMVGFNQDCFASKNKQERCKGIGVMCKIMVSLGF